MCDYIFLVFHKCARIGNSEVMLYINSEVIKLQVTDFRNGRRNENKQ